MKTTTDLMQAALQLKEEAKHVSNEREHAAWWDRKVEVYLLVNEALESGAFTGEAYDELWQANNAIYSGEAYASRYVREA